MVGLDLFFLKHKIVSGIKQSYDGLAAKTFQVKTFHAKKKKYPFTISIKIDVLC